MSDAPESIRPADPDTPEALGCLAAYFGMLADRIPGLDPATLVLPDPEAFKYRAPTGLFLLAQSKGRATGCIALAQLDPRTAEIKRLWVAPEARGRGLARRLMHRAGDEARRMGYTALKLDTNAALTEALALYAAEGWQPVEPYTDYPATHWFAKTLF